MKRLISTFVAAMGLAALAGCMPQQSQWAGNETSMRNTVDLVRVAHDVKFEDKSAALSQEEEARLKAFLSKTGFDYSDRLFLDLPENDDAAAKAGIEKQAEAVVAELAKLGHDVYAKPLAYGKTPAANTVRIVVERYVVTPPDCPDWRQPASPNYENAPSSNFGCANTTSLGLMVANPRDLIEGRDYEPSDAADAAAAVRRYREDKVKWGDSDKSANISKGVIDDN